MKRLIIPAIIVLMIAPFLLIAQEDDSADLLLSISGKTCALELVEIEVESTPEASPESTPEAEVTTPDWLPDLLTYIVGEECEDIEPLLTVPRNGTLWLALLYGDEWLPLDTLEDDPNPPQLDGRGRYFGCAIPDEGEQVCNVVVMMDEVDYLVAVPLWVGDAYYAPQAVETEVPEVQETPDGDNPPPQNTGGNQPPAACAPVGNCYDNCVLGELPPIEMCGPPPTTTPGGYCDAARAPAYTCYDSCGNVCDQHPGLCSWTCGGPD